jgi:hypothetical protein
MRFHLRTLMILLAFGPPILAYAWTNQESMGSGFHAPSYRNPKAVERLERVRTVHVISGVCAILLYPLAVLMQFEVFMRWRDWRELPERTPMSWAAMLVALLAFMSCAVFFFTFPYFWVPDPRSGYGQPL